MLTRAQLHAYFAALGGWSLDAFDFFIFVFCLKAIGGEFHTGVKSVAEGIFLTLAFRPVGALVFGWLAEKYGRRPILMLNVASYSAVQLATAFAPNLATLLALRALFGFAMGGEWGVGAALALETLPAKGRGFFSGLLQEGYVIGYLLASIVFAYLFVHVGWRGMFIVSAGSALLVLYIRYGVEESPAWLAGVAPRRDARQPGRGFLDSVADVQHQQCRPRADDEHAAPTDVNEQVRKHDRRQQIADHVAFLEQSGEKAAALRRQRFECQCGTHAPLTAHGEAEQRTQREQGREIGREGRGELHRRVAGDVQHQDRPSTILLGQPAEHQCPDRTERQGEEDPFGHRLHAGVELAADRLQAEDENEEVERVQRPPTERGKVRVQLRARQHPEGVGHGAIGLRNELDLLDGRGADLAGDLVLRAGAP